jgi:hypothetical protein
MEAIRSSETSVLIRATRCHLPEDDNHHRHRRGNLKSYVCIINLSDVIYSNLKSVLVLKYCTCIEGNCILIYTGNLLIALQSQSYCWSSPAQSFSGSSPTGLMTIFYCLRFETPLTWRARSQYLYPPGTGWRSYTPRQLFIALQLEPECIHTAGASSVRLNSWILCIACSSERIQRFSVVPAFRWKETSMQLFFHWTCRSSDCDWLFLMDPSACLQPFNLKTEIDQVFETFCPFRRSPKPKNSAIPSEVHNRLAIYRLWSPYLFVLIMMRAARCALVLVAGECRYWRL